MGVGAREPIEAIKKPTGGEGANDADVQNLANSPGGILIKHCSDPIEGFDQHRHQRLSVIGERQAARQTMEQAGTQAPFEQCDLMTDRALAHAQFDCGAGEAKMARRRFKRPQGIERNLGAVHR